MHEHSASDLLTDLGLLALAIIWGVNFVVVKFALSVIEPLAFNALRFPLACLVLYWVLRARGDSLVPRKKDVGTLIGLGILGHVLYQLVFIYGLDLTLAGNASVLLATSPVWTAMLAAGLGHERPGLWVWIGAAGTLAGMALVVVGGGGGLELGGNTLPGDLLMILAAVAWALFTVLARPLVLEYGPLRVTAWTVWIGAVGLILLGVPTVSRMDFGAVPLGAWAAVGYAGVFALAVAYVAWYRGVEKLGSSRTAVYSNVVPIVALLTAWIWLGEVPTGPQVAGAALVIGSVTLARLRGAPAKGLTPRSRAASDA